MFLIPLSRQRYSLDWLFILDPFFTGIPAAALVAAAIWRKRARAITAAGAVLLAAYIRVCALMHARALSLWIALDGPPAGRRVAVVPQFLSPFRWLGLSEHESEMHAAFFDIGPFARGLPEPKPPESVLDALRTLPDFYPPPERIVVRRFPSATDSPW